MSGLNKAPGVFILCSRCGTRLMVTDAKSGYKTTYWVEGHDCKETFIKNQVRSAKSDGIYYYSHDTVWDGNPEEAQ